MEKKLNDDRNLMFLIFRSCRLCGGGGGYKMPLVTPAAPLKNSGVDLLQKIRECVQIEVQQDDHMPPLICELCVDKINDFYEFLEMCRQTDRDTRLKLGLPLVTLSTGNHDTENCILGTTGNVFSNNTESKQDIKVKSKLTPKKIATAGPAASKRRSSPTPEPYVKISKSPILEKKKKSKIEESRRSSRFSNDNDISESPTPEKKKKPKIEDSKRSSRFSNDNDIDEVRRSRRDSSLSSDDIFKKYRGKDEVNNQESKTATQKKSILKKSQAKLEPPDDKAKTTESKKSVKIHGKTPKGKQTEKCNVCSKSCQKIEMATHMYIYHYVQYTKPDLACNACRDWFPTPEEMAEHDKWHSEGNCYSCKQCYDDFDTYREFLDHVPVSCIPIFEVSDMQCDDCLQYFPTLLLLRTHDCWGDDGKPADNCYRCNMKCDTVRMKREHEAVCDYRPRVLGCLVDPEVKSLLREVRIRTRRCDELLKRRVRKRYYDVSKVDKYYGYDDAFDYPYSDRPKMTPFKAMVNIQDDFFFDSEDVEYVHWDSESDDEVLAAKVGKVEPLSRLCLKKIFSRSCLGKVPRKRKKIRSDIDKAESILSSIIDNDCDSTSVLTTETQKRTTSFNINSILCNDFE